MADGHFGSLVYEDNGGKGDCVVMLHGLGGSSNTFETLMPALADYRVIRVDVPGAGRSAPRYSASSIADLSKAVTDALKAAGIHRAFIIGHSMGTLLAQHMAASAPERVTGLALLGALTEPSDAARIALQERSGNARRHGMSAIADAVADNALSANTTSRFPAARAFVRESLMRQEPAAYALHCTVLSQARAIKPVSIRCPVSLITGSEDKVAPVQMARTLHSSLPFSTLHILDNVGHWPTIEAPADCIRYIVEALHTIHHKDESVRS